MTNNGHGVGVGYSGGSALVLPHLGHNFRGDGYRKPRAFGCYQVAQHPLMGGVSKGMKEAYCGRFHAESQEFVHRPLGFQSGERDQDSAVVIQSLGDLESPAPGTQRLGQLQEYVVYVVAHLPAYLQSVAEAARGQKAGCGTLTFDNQVGHQRGAVDGLTHITGGNAIALQHLANDLDDRLGRVAAGSQPLAHRNEA